MRRILVDLGWASHRAHWFVYRIDFLFLKLGSFSRTPNCHEDISFFYYYFKILFSSQRKLEKKIFYFIITVMEHEKHLH